jgi:hypothetical protein
MKNNRVEKNIAVYAYGTLSEAEPDLHISNQEARNLINGGLARKINHNTAVRLSYGVTLEGAVVRCGSFECTLEAKLMAKPERVAG